MEDNNEYIYYNPYKYHQNNLYYNYVNKNNYPFHNFYDNKNQIKKRIISESKPTNINFHQNNFFPNNINNFNGNILIPRIKSFNDNLLEHSIQHSSDVPSTYNKKNISPFFRKNDYQLSNENFSNEIINKNPNINYLINNNLFRPKVIKNRIFHCIFDN